MNADLTAGWVRRYQTALRHYLDQGPGASLRPAHRLGRQAVALGLEPLDLAKMHAQALTPLVSPGGSFRTRQHRVARAKFFFAETLVPIERTHRTARQTDLRIHRLTQILRRRMVESTAARRLLARGIAQRQAVEATLKQRARRLRLLRESTRRQRRVRAQTRAILSAQEDERQRVSLRLHAEIAQALIAIDLWLLALKKAAQTDTASLKKGLDSTQSQVNHSAQTIKRFAHELVIQHQT